VDAESEAHHYRGEYDGVDMERQRLVGEFEKL
jgi:hypothetical protein